MIDTISGLRAYALKHARALRVLRSVKSQGQAAAYQDMGTRLGELEKQSAAREPLVQEVIRLMNDRMASMEMLRDAARKLAEWKP